MKKGLRDNSEYVGTGAGEGELGGVASKWLK